MPKSELETLMRNWDTKDTSVLAENYEIYCIEVWFPSLLIAALRDKSMQDAGSWLLKYHLDDGAYLDNKQSKAIIKALNTLQSWPSRLHILQCLAKLQVQAEDKTSVWKFLRSNLSRENKFIRAWSYHGIFELACRFEEYRKDATAMLTMAERDESASIKARIRQIRKDRRAVWL